MEIARRGVVGFLICLAAFSACKRNFRPDEKRAKTEFQRMLDGLNYGVWRVDKVTRTNGRFTTREGTRAYVMDAEVEVTIIHAINRDELIARGLKMLIDVWNGKAWLLHMLGPSGERKIISMHLLWIEKDKGWELVGPCSDCE